VPAQRGPVDVPELGRRRRPLPAEELVGRMLDVLLSLTLLIVLLLPLLVVALAILASDGGPVLFRQPRVGRGGRMFTMLKFRTMRTGGGDDADLRQLISRELSGEDTVEDGSSKLDSRSRLCPLGPLLRCTSIDELPQLWNVLRGEMAVVGPRPCLVWEAEMFPREYWIRFAVRPGLTGLWQVSGRSRLGTLDMLRLDAAYVRTRSLWTDVLILLRTVPVLLRGDGAR
jgi:lipopolysaccharide/colanic/teichoic acid biosynthesis glycosyltransferase